MADRRDAGLRLAQELKKREYSNPLILAIPRGGVEVAYPVAQTLEAPMDLIIPRKLGAPGNPEMAVGAVGPDGTVILDQRFPRYGIDQEQLKQMVEQELQEIQRRMKVYRGDAPSLDTAGCTVILVDDGIATGYTVEAALSALRHQPLHKLVLAIPVAPADTLDRLRPLVDELICLYIPEHFWAVGQFYQDFTAASDQDVTRLLELARQGGNG